MHRRKQQVVRRPATYARYRTDAGGLLKGAAADTKVLRAPVLADRRAGAGAGVAVHNAYAEVGAIVATRRHGRVAEAAAILADVSTHLVRRNARARLVKEAPVAAT